MTDACENITLAKTLFRPVNITNLKRDVVHVLPVYELSIHSADHPCLRVDLQYGHIRVEDFMNSYDFVLKYSIGILQNKGAVFGYFTIIGRIYGLFFLVIKIPSIGGSG